MHNRRYGKKNQRHLQEPGSGIIDRVWSLGELLAD